MSFTWGLLSSESLPNTRRSRTLGLGASVRFFNERAVPGLGGVKFGRQLFLATLGVAVAETARSHDSKVQNIEVANAIEALACWLAFEKNGWKSDLRLRGNTKLRGKEDFTFKKVKQRNFYVTQPMRMATVQALPALGFVDAEGSRFNTFVCSDAGRTFIEMATKEFRPYNRSVVEHLALWVLAQHDRIDGALLQKALSPIEPLSRELVSLIREQLIRGGKEPPEDKVRRRNALDWVESLRISNKRQGWEEKPENISVEHWHDLKAGALFFKARDAALKVLNAVESYIGNQSSKRAISLNEQIPKELNDPIKELRLAANEFKQIKHTDNEAVNFCNQCVNVSPSHILHFLVGSDDSVLRLAGDEIKPGPAFRGVQSQPGSDEVEEERLQTKETPLPDGISFRMRNLYLLNLDMCGELDDWLNKDGGEV